MYIIHNNTKQTVYHHEGSWPVDELEEQLNKGDKVIVISLYSNKIKVPNKVEYNGKVWWEWDNFPLFR